MYCHQLCGIVLIMGGVIRMGKHDSGAVQVQETSGLVVLIKTFHYDSFSMQCVTEQHYCKKSLVTKCTYVRFLQRSVLLHKIIIIQTSLVFLQRFGVTHAQYIELQLCHWPIPPRG